MITAKSTLVEVAFEVGTALDRAGFTAVLTGGSAATYYAPRSYVSDDLDFVITLAGKKGEVALEELGYRRTIDFYVHSLSRFPLEFPPGPLAIGDDLVTEWSTVHKRSSLLYVLTPTDSCRDRLASYLFWNDFSGLEQALAVCRARPKAVDLKAVGEWCVRERQAEKFELFKSRLTPPKRRKRRPA